MFADEADGKDADLLDDDVVVIHVAGDLLDDPVPLFSRDFDAAKCCDYLSDKVSTLAAALRMGLCWSTIVPSTMSLNADLLGGVMASQRKPSLV